MNRPHFNSQGLNFHGGERTSCFSRLDVRFAAETKKQCIQNGYIEKSRGSRGNQYTKVPMYPKWIHWQNPTAELEKHTVARNENGQFLPCVQSEHTVNGRNRTADIVAAEQGGNRMITRYVNGERIRLLTVQELAEILSVTERTARSYLYSGLIPFCRIGRRYFVTPENVSAYLRGASSTRRKKAIKAPSFQPDRYPSDPWES